jgi:hypothetical protein
LGNKIKRNYSAGDPEVFFTGATSFVELLEYLFLVIRMKKKKLPVDQAALLLRKNAFNGPG